MGLPFGGLCGELVEAVADCVGIGDACGKAGMENSDRGQILMKCAAAIDNRKRGRKWACKFKHVFREFTYLPSCIPFCLNGSFSQNLMGELCQ